MNREELFDKLKQADEEIFMICGNERRIDIIIVGGSSLIIRGLLSRQTPDIDVLNFYHNLESVFNKYDMNSRVLAFGESFAENYEDRLENVDIETKVINYKMISLEDLVIMKLHSTRPKDKEDITSPDVLTSLNWDKLDSIVQSGEVDVSFNERQYRLFIENYEKYKKEYRPK